MAGDAEKASGKGQARDDSRSRNLWVEHPIVLAVGAFAIAATLIALGMGIQAALTSDGPTMTEVAGPTVASQASPSSTSTSQIAAVDTSETTTTGAATSTSTSAFPSTAAKPVDVGLSKLPILEIEEYDANCCVAGLNDPGTAAYDEVEIGGTEFSRSSLVVTVFDWNGNRTPGWTSLQLDLGRDYDTLSTTIGLDDRSASRASVRVDILNELDELLYTRDFRLGESDVVELDVSSVLRLKIVVATLDEIFEGPDFEWRYLGFGDPILTTKVDS